MNRLRGFPGIIFDNVPIIIWCLALLIATGIIGKSWQEKHRSAVLFYLFLLFGLGTMLTMIWNYFTFVQQTVSTPQFSSGPMELPRGYQIRLLPNGGTEIIPPWPRPGVYSWVIVAFTAVWSLSWTYDSVRCLLNNLGKSGFATCLTVLLIGLVPVYWVVHSHLLRHSWVAGPGWVARRTYVPFLGRFWDRVYSNLSGFEIQHGIWKTRKGSTDTLWLRTAGSSRKIRVDVQMGIWRFTRELVREKELHELTVDPNVAAMGRFLANKSGTRLNEITEEIPEPQTGA